MLMNSLRGSPPDMMKKTRILLEVRWDPEIQDHPFGWEWGYLLASDPFSTNQGVDHKDEVRTISFEDVDEQASVEQE